MQAQPESVAMACFGGFSRATPLELYARSLRKRNQRAGSKDAAATLFPMYTVPIKEFLQMTVMEPHETLKERGQLVSFEKGMGSAAFISHQWVGENSPDPDFRQMSVLQDAIRSLMSTQKRIYHDIHTEMFLNTSGLCTSALSSNPLFFWYDYFSCPQLDKNRDFQQAVVSIPGYIARCEFFFALVPVIENPRLCKVFTPSSWSERGWCLVEKLFRQLSHDSSWIVIKSASEIELASHMGFSGSSPGEGLFSESGDKAKLAPIVQKSLQRKLRLLLEEEDLVGYRVLLNLQPVLLRGMMVQPLYSILPANKSDSASNRNPASHEVAEFLLQNGFETVFDVDTAGWSPLHYAALRGEVLLIQGLLEQHADPCQVTKRANPSHGGPALGLWICSSATGTMRQPGCCLQPRLRQMAGGSSSRHAWETTPKAFGSFARVVVTHLARIPWVLPPSALPACSARQGLSKSSVCKQVGRLQPKPLQSRSMPRWLSKAARRLSRL